jgi:hypothetical protein
VNAPKSSWRDAMPGFLQFLESELNYRVRSHAEVLGFDIYFVDFSAWRLRFSDHTSVIWIKAADVAALRDQELAQSLVDIVRSRNLMERDPIALVDANGERLRELLKSTFLPILVLDQGDQDAVRTSRRPTGELQDRLSSQLSLALLAPYETSKPVMGSRFFGRDQEVRRILQGGESNFAIMGIRRIGKTSLMREIEHRLRDQVREEADATAQDRIVFMDCSAFSSSAEFVREVVRKLHPQELARLENRQYMLYFPDFLDRMARRFGGPLVFLLDEFDQMLIWHSKDPTVLNALRSSSNMGYCRYVIAGFRAVMQAFANLESPLYNFAKPIRLKEFTRDQTAELVLGPLETLRVRFQRRNEIVDRIYNETAGQPNLVQFYCSILVEQLDHSGSRTISPESLYDVYESEDFRAFVLSTFMDNTTNLEKVLVFAVLARYGQDQPFDAEAIDTALRERQVDIPLEHLSRACRNLELAGTFAQKGWHYHFAAPVFPRVLAENQNVEFLFRKVMQEGLW